MAESPAFSENESTRTDGEESGSELPIFEINTSETTDVQPTVLFPQRRTSLEKTFKTRRAYSEMIETALFQLNETRTGSSRQAIVKYIRANYEVSDNANRYVSLAMVKLLEKKTIVQKSGVGMTGKFTLTKEIREARRKGASVKPKGKQSAKATGKSNETNAKDKTKGEGKKTTDGKSKTAKADKVDEVDSDKENKPKAKKTSNKNGGAKASGGRAKKDKGEEKKSKAANKKQKTNEKGKTKEKANKKTSKESKATSSKAKPKAKEAKESQSKTKGNAKEKGNEKEKGAGGQDKKAGQTKNTKKKEDKPTKQKGKN